jgi:hypothetical protein
MTLALNVRHNNTPLAWGQRRVVVPIIGAFSASIHKAQPAFVL